MNSFSFIWPWIFLLLPLPAFVPKNKNHNNTVAVSLPPALSGALDSIQDNQTSRSIRFDQRLIPWSCWILLLCAIAQPVVNGQSSVQSASGRAIALAIDISGSMEREDFSLNGQASDRLTIVKKVARDFIEHQAGDRIALVLFADEAFIASPLSFDIRSVAGYLDSAGIGMAGRSTAIGDAIGLAVKALRDDPATRKAIVLLSDGTNNSGTVEPEAAAQLATEMSIAIHTIAMASDQEAGGFNTSPSADLDEETLEKIAETSGGRFFRARTTQELQAIYAAISQLETAETNAPEVVLQHDLRNIFLFALFLLLLFWEVRRRGGTLSDKAIHNKIESRHSPRPAQTQPGPMNTESVSGANSHQ